MVGGVSQSRGEPSKRIDGANRLATLCQRGKWLHLLANRSGAMLVSRLLFYTFSNNNHNFWRPGYDH